MEGAVPGLSPWLAGSCFLPVSLHTVFLHTYLCVPISLFYKDINYSKLPHFDYFCKDPISK